MTTPERVMTIELRPGPFVGPVLRRVVGLLAARADMPVDRVDEVILLAETMAQTAARHVAGERLGVRLGDADGTLRVEFGPLEPGVAANGLSGGELPADDDRAEVRSGEGGEYLVLTVGT